jgi:hypothetical protein
LRRLPSAVHGLSRVGEVLFAELPGGFVAARAAQPGVRTGCLSSRGSTVTDTEFAAKIARLLETLGLSGPPLTERHLSTLANHLGYELRFEDDMREGTKATKNEAV